MAKNPPVSYNFKVSFAPGSLSLASSMLAMASLAMDASFSQISGLKTEMEYDVVRSGGLNDQVYHLPKGVKRSTFTLKRGLASFTSPLLLWCFGSMEDPDTINPRTLIVTLLDKNPSMPPVMIWALFNVIPVKWEINDFDATKSEIVIESIDVVFSKMIIL